MTKHIADLITVIRLLNRVESKKIVYLLSVQLIGRYTDLVEMKNKDLI